MRCDTSPSNVYRDLLSYCFCDIDALCLDVATEGSNVSLTPPQIAVNLFQERLSYVDGEHFSKSDVQNPSASNRDVSRLKTRSRVRLINLCSLSLVLSMPPCNPGIREVPKKINVWSNCGLLFLHLFYICYLLKIPCLWTTFILL